MWTDLRQAQYDENHIDLTEDILSYTFRSGRQRCSRHIAPPSLSRDRKGRLTPLHLEEELVGSIHINSSCHSDQSPRTSVLNASQSCYDRWIRACCADHHSSTGPMISGPHPQNTLTPAQMQAQQQAQMQATDRAKLRSRKPTDKNIPEGVEECIIGDGVQQYRDLRDLERRFDATMMRKRLDIIDAVNRHAKVSATISQYTASADSSTAIQNPTNMGQQHRGRPTMASRLPRCRRLRFQYEYGFFLQSED